ncbi:hypothetical protein QR721_04440 [Aciduricibacillus chroicocephali]|uniref:Uncharacterized protein n=1 Tax=Aciduricibacillus chroicocephali TaxID=3054939 RepID=A0ABY9KXS0_9BACI|nr:hypothetical protein QR721_04440 [Bacillaceae bacterium 44XB]
MDLLLEMLADSHPLYLYIGMFITVYCSCQLFQLRFGKLALHSNNDYWRSIHTHEAMMNRDDYVFPSIEALHGWIVLKMKRTDGPDDDSEPSFFLKQQYRQTVNEEEENEKTCIHFFETIQTYLASRSANCHSCRMWSV